MGDLEACSGIMGGCFNILTKFSKLLLVSLCNQVCVSGSLGTTVALIITHASSPTLLLYICVPKALLLTAIIYIESHGQRK